MNPNLGWKQRAALQGRLERATDALQAAREYFDSYGDGAPDSPAYAKQATVLGEKMARTLEAIRDDPAPSSGEKDSQEDLMQDLLSIKDAARETGLSISWWRQRVTQKKVPYYKVGRRVLIDRRDIENLMRASRVEAQEPADH